MTILPAVLAPEGEGGTPAGDPQEASLLVADVIGQALTRLLPETLRRRLWSLGDAARTLGTVRNRDVFGAMVRPVCRGFVLRVPFQSSVTAVRTRHDASFEWSYSDGQTPEMEALYQRAQQAQWTASTALPWDTSVDPMNPEVALLPKDFFDFEALAALGIRLNAHEQQRFRVSFVAWMLSQFLHGEQGALYAAAQVVEAVPWLDGKKFGATQVMDEARHVESFQRYLKTKVQASYPVDDNLFVVMDTLLGDRRWDVKFVGMQLIVEGLALSAFGVLYRRTSEPLLKMLLHRILQDEARHVQFGLQVLQRHVSTLSDRERHERKEWAFEMTELMRNRFYAYAVYEEWFAHRISRRQWRALMTTAPGMKEFRRVMFGRVVRNLRQVGLLSDRVQGRSQ